MTKKRINNQWEDLGKTDPYWAVIASPDNINGRCDKDDFFKTGLDEIKAVLKKIASLGIEIHFNHALDYGCGVGRLSRGLSHFFQRVTGVDFSGAMLNEAKSANSAHKTIQFIQNNGEDIRTIANETVDFVYSNIALQHSERHVQISLIKEFARILRPEAILVFQTPSSHDLKTLTGLAHRVFGNPVLNVIKRLYFGKGHVMEMHTLSRPVVVKLLEGSGMMILDIEENRSAGKAFVSYTYYAQKKGTISQERHQS